MPELPDVLAYCEALAERVRGHVLQRVHLRNPFVLRTAVPPLADAEGRRVDGVRRFSAESAMRTPTKSSIGRGSLRSR